MTSINPGWRNRCEYTHLIVKLLAVKKLSWIPPYPRVLPPVSLLCKPASTLGVWSFEKKNLITCLLKCFNSSLSPSAWSPNSLAWKPAFCVWCWPTFQLCFCPCLTYVMLPSHGTTEIPHMYYSLTCTPHLCTCHSPLWGALSARGTSHFKCLFLQMVILLSSTRDPSSNLSESESESRPVRSNPLQAGGLYSPWNFLQARILEWVAIPFFRGFSQPRDWPQVSRIAGRFFTSWATREAQEYWSG